MLGTLLDFRPRCEELIHQALALDGAWGCPPMSLIEKLLCHRLTPCSCLTVELLHGAGTFGFCSPRHPQNIGWGLAWTEGE